MITMFELIKDDEDNLTKQNNDVERKISQKQSSRTPTFPLQT